MGSPLPLIDNLGILKDVKLYKCLKRLEKKDEATLENYSWLDKRAGALGELQKRFLLSNKTICGIVGPNKIGKTYLGVAKFCSYMTGIYPDYFPEELKLETPVKGRIILNDFGIMYFEDLLPYLEKWIPSWMYDEKLPGGGYRKKNNAGVYSRWQLTKREPCNGSSFHLISNEQDVRTCEGTAIQVLLSNEPHNEDKFEASMRGGVTKGIKVMFVLTPLGLSGWIIDKVVPREDAEILFAEDIRENYTLNEEAIKSFEKSLSPEEKKARMYGKPLHFAGRVFKEFDRDVHVVSSEAVKIPDGDWENKFLVVDPHEATNWAFMWGWINPLHQIYWYDYLWIEADKTFKDYVERIKAKERNGKVQLRIMDARYCNKPYMDSGGKKTSEGFRELGIYFERANGDSNYRITMMHEYLKYDRDKPITQYNTPSMFWLDYLDEPIRQMERCTWKDLSSKQVELKETSGKIVARNSHFPEAASFLAAVKPKYQRRGATHRLIESIKPIQRSYW